MIKQALLLFLILSTAPASAIDGVNFAATVGVSSSYFRTTDANHPSFSPELGMLLGAIATYDFSQTLSFRSGAYFTQRVSDVSVNGENAKLNFGYIYVPIDIMYRFDRFEMFAGIVPAIKTSSDCSGEITICNADYVASANAQMVGAQVGSEFNFDKHWSADVIFDLGLTENSIDTHANAFSVSLVYMF